MAITVFDLPPETDSPPAELSADLLEGETSYKIFHVKAKWSQDGAAMTDEPDWRTAGLAAGRLWNSVGYYKMPKVDATIEAVLRAARDAWWPQYSTQEKYRDLRYGDFTCEVAFERWETWCPGHFSHWTWDLGVDDDVILRGFHRYVTRIEGMNHRHGHVVDGLYREPVCLMGAEDPHRWRGKTLGDCSDDDRDTDPPCRCPECKKVGIVRIIH